MIYIDLKGVELTAEMRLWIHRETSSKWRLGDKMVHDGIWKQPRREYLGVWMDGEEAIIFRLKFGL